MESAQTQRDGCDSSQEPNIDIELFSGELCCFADNKVPALLPRGIVL